MVAVPTWLSTVRALRPAHAINALQRNPELLLLNPRDLRRAVAGPVPRLPAPLGAMLPAILRGARDAGGTLGLVKPGALQGEGPLPGAFAQAVFRAAEEVGFKNPFFLATPPLPLGEADATGEHLRAEVQRYLDAGFTEVVVRGDGRPAAAAGPALKVALEAAKEREVSLVVRAPTPEAALDLYAALARAGVVLDLLSVEAPIPAEGRQQFLDLCRPAGLELAGEPAEELRGLDLGGPLAALASSLVGGPVGPERFRELDEADEARRERAEALTYAEVLSLLQQPPLRGAGARALNALSAQPGY